MNVIMYKAAGQLLSPLNTFTQKSECSFFPVIVQSLNTWQKRCNALWELKSVPEFSTPQLVYPLKSVIIHIHQAEIKLPVIKENTFNI